MLPIKRKRITEKTFLLSVNHSFFMTRVALYPYPLTASLTSTSCDLWDHQKWKMPIKSSSENKVQLFFFKALLKPCNQKLHFPYCVSLLDCILLERNPLSCLYLCCYTMQGLVKSSGRRIFCRRHGNHCCCFTF